MCRKPKHSAGLSGVFNYSLTFAVERGNRETKTGVNRTAKQQAKDSPCAGKSATISPRVYTDTKRLDKEQ